MIANPQQESASNCERLMRNEKEAKPAIGTETSHNNKLGITSNARTDLLVCRLLAVCHPPTHQSEELVT